MADPTTAEQVISTTSLNDLGKAIAEGIASQNPKKLTFGQYQARENRGRVKLRLKAYQNGIPIDESVLSNEEIKLFNQIDRSGRYIDRRVEVLYNDDMGEKSVDIRYKNKTADDRFEFRGFVRNIADLLKQVIEANKADDDANGVVEAEPVRRPFGSSKATQEARERAGVAA